MKSPVRCRRRLDQRVYQAARGRRFRETFGRCRETAGRRQAEHSVRVTVSPETLEEAVERAILQCEGGFGPASGPLGQLPPAKAGRPGPGDIAEHPRPGKGHRDTVE